MPSIDDRRDSRRLYVGPEQTIRFVAKGHPFREVRITNVSEGGCFAMVTQRDQGLFTPGTVLEQFAFEHAGMPQGQLTAEVRYALGAQSENPMLDFLGVGIQFLAVPEGLRKGLVDLIQAALG